MEWSKENKAISRMLNEVGIISDLNTEHGKANVLCARFGGIEISPYAPLAICANCDWRGPFMLANWGTGYHAYDDERNGYHYNCPQCDFIIWRHYNAPNNAHMSSMGSIKIG